VTPHTDAVAPQLARRLLYAIAAVCVISTGVIALIRPAPLLAPRSAPLSHVDEFLPIAGSSSLIYSTKHGSYVYTLNGNSESFSLQKLCAVSNVTCSQVVFRSAPP
jgi:hypothetical protein